MSQSVPHGPRRAAFAPAVTLLVSFFLLAAPPARASWEEATATFRTHYTERLGEVGVERRPIDGGEEIALTSPLLRGPGNQPVLLLHEGPTRDVVVLIHGLTDSPYYMRAIADRFFAAGANVVLPLLPAHGLLEPDEAFEDRHLADKWKACTRHAVDVAVLLGDRVSIGGLSTGGALSVHAALTDPERLNGGVFLFSAALSVGGFNEFAGRLGFLFGPIARAQDRGLKGVGPNPYKYPQFSSHGGLQLTHLIREINKRESKAGPRQRVFAVHSIHDEAAFPKGLGRLLRSEGVQGVAVVAARNPAIEHASLVLEHDIELDPELITTKKPPPTPRANPVFDNMMNLAITFFRNLPELEDLPAEQ